MSSEKLKQYASTIGIARLIIVAFFLCLCFTALALNMSLNDLLTNTFIRVGMNGVLVLAMIPGIRCGIGLNFGFALGIVGGLLGSLVAMEFSLSGWSSFIVAVIIGLVISSIFGFLYGLLLNMVKGSEMTVATYVGFSIVALMNIGWLVLPFNHPAIRWPIGEGLRGTISTADSFGELLNNFLSFTIFDITIPTGALLFFGFCCFLMWLFLNSKLGISMTAAGENPLFAKAAGIDVNKMRIIGTTVSTAVASVGIIMYAQSFGFIQLYNAPLMMSFSAVAAILIGGSSITKSKVTHAIIGVFLFQGIISMSLPVANKLLPEGNLSEVMRLIISNGIILYSLTKAGGAAANE